jgi:hypothetical protein
MWGKRLRLWRPAFALPGYDAATFAACPGGWLAEPKLQRSEGWWARQGSNL